MRPDYPSNCPYPISVPKNRDKAQIDGPVQVSLRCSAAYRKPQLFIEHIRRCALKQRGKTAQCHDSMIQYDRAQYHHTQHGTIWNGSMSWQHGAICIDTIQTQQDIVLHYIIHVWIICTSPVYVISVYMLTQLAYRIDSTRQPATQYMVCYSMQIIHNQQAIFGGF